MHIQTQVVDAFMLDIHLISRFGGWQQQEISFGWMIDAFFGCDPKPVLELAGWKMIWLSRAQRKVAKAI